MGIYITKGNITSNVLMQRKGNLLFNIIDGEVVILSIETNKYYGIDKVGSRIWELLEQPVNFQMIVSTLREEYDVSELQCNQDTLTFLKKMEDNNLLTIFQ
jgi:hypothetical protein